MCVGFVLAVVVLLVPSPHWTTYWLALPTAVIVSVAVKPDPPATTLLVKETLFTNVLLRIFSVTSLSASIASVTLVEVVNP